MVSLIESTPILHEQMKTSSQLKRTTRDKPYGVVDFALTNLDYDAVTSRLEQTSTNISYEAPKSGGRTKPDGTELKWQVTFPTGIDRGAVPFWCEDETPRARRVPATAENTTHACGVAGMAGVMVEVKREQVPRLAEAIAAIAGVEEGAREYEVGAPNGVEGLDAPSIRVKEAAAGEGAAQRELRLTLVLQTPEHRRQEAIREEVGDGVVAISFE